MACWRPLYSLLFFIYSLGGFHVSAHYINASVIPGAWQIDSYLPALKDKKVALLINQTSVVGKSSLLDTLLKRKVKIVKIFVPEHGFRGTAEAGENIENAKDAATGLQVISLYGKTKKPTKEMLAGIDILVYDLQD